MYKLCIWETTVSPHQSAFFKLLSEDEQCDLAIRYFETLPEDRLGMGWRDDDVSLENEQYVMPSLNDALSSMKDFHERIHILPGNHYPFIDELIHYCIEHHVKWVHWSERSGFLVAQKLNYHMSLFPLLQWVNIMKSKREYAKTLNEYALGVFAQGDLAKKDFLQWGVKKEKIAHLFYSIFPLQQPMKAPNEYAQFKDKTVFVYVGSLSLRKGVTVLLQAFAALKNRENAALVLVGDDRSNGAYAKEAKRLGIAQQCHFLGPKPMHEVPAYIAFGDLFILPTLFDGWGAVLNEATALGKPVISTDQCGAAYHAIDEGHNGFRVKAGSVKMLSEAMQRYINDTDLIASHAQASKVVYETVLDPKNNITRLYNAIDQWSRQ